ncbi:molybdopterin synthase catalytic subunit [Reichenbachiella faecimaris]|uniref:Molybdopterin synthase catalytic subunit n=1 Tax=Reichenbachiella faecimaris TaxID=692418 RepID=A0A1W2G7P2_REIFA|nr:molybdenum cofactor biosynthesis protein MoaE [Reichenbachiella faecimaris]SMD32700.1 molybdopterin synthase catalytic subunit [Reichenbachiella faecimaris]
MIEITKTKIDVAGLIAAVSHEGAGATDVFIGTTRNKTSDKTVVKLDFEAYEPMAIKELQKIVDRAKQQWPILKYAVVHRVGVVEIGEEAVVIAVSTPHRQAAFESCRFIIDELKKSVPIWKKEIFEDGDVWVAAHP